MYRRSGYNESKHLIFVVILHQILIFILRLRKSVFVSKHERADADNIMFLLMENIHKIFSLQYCVCCENTVNTMLAAKRTFLFLISNIELKPYRFLN